MRIIISPAKQMRVDTDSRSITDIQEVLMVEIMLHLMNILS